MIGDLLSKGYFPQELPPPFHTATLASSISSNLAGLGHPFIFDPSQRSNISRSGRFNLARTGSLRRILNILNPVNYIQLANVIHNEWNDIDNHVRQSPISLSRPKITPNSPRAFERFVSLGELPEVRAHTRIGCRYLLKTDISTFYPSVYTHSIPWALHSKPTAKSQRRYAQLLGNRIDTLVRNAQDQQTKGIPIGPDTSLLIAESILTSIDLELANNIQLRGFRYVDDYELGFSSFAEAESALSTLQELLIEYELQLNPNKTKIDELPTRIEPLWVSELRRFEFRSVTRTQKADLVYYFDCAFDMWRNNPDEYVLKYAASRSKSFGIDAYNWELYESLLLNCALAEPGALPIIVDQFKRYLEDGFLLDKTKIQETFARIVEAHALHGHGSKVAWVLWGSLILGIPIDNQTANLISRINDSVVALLALDAKQKGLIDASIGFANWLQFMGFDELYDQNWLIAYEAFEQGWLPSSSGLDYIAGDPCFAYFRSQNISFYDNQASISYTPPLIQTQSYIGGGGGGISPE